MYRSMTCYIRGLNKAEYAMLREMCRYANNLYNKALYEVRQHYFATGKYLCYERNYHVCRDNENYRMLQNSVAQHVLKRVDYAFKSFFALLRLVDAGKYPAAKVRIPHYREKNGLYSLVLPIGKGGCSIFDGRLCIPQSWKFLAAHGKHRIRLDIPPQLHGKQVREVHIIPIARARAFKIQYVYLCEPEDLHLNPDNALSVDFGIDNLAACVSSSGSAFIMDGRRIKSINHRWNKERARLQSVYMKQHIFTGRSLELLTVRRNDQVQDIMRKTARYIISYCIAHDIGTLIVGCNPCWKQSVSIGKANTQNFVQIPHAYLRLLLKWHCERYGMTYIEQEESYTSKASFLDNDPLPSYGDKDIPFFSGQRIKRGLYRTASGQLINADINGAANIMRKSKQKGDYARLCRGLTVSPARIRLV